MAARSTRQSSLVLTGVEGWRAVAALLVVAAHVWTNMGRDGSGTGPGLDHPALGWTMQNLDIVIDLFFVLSGMLIWLPFAAAAFDDRAEVPHGGVFFVRRAMRFLPLYLVVVLVEWSLHNYDVADADWIDLAEHLTLTQSLDSTRIFYTIGPAWTLSVEWFFYLAMSFLAPSFVRWIRRGRGTPSRMLRFLAGTLPILLGSLLYKAVVASVIVPPETDWAWRFGPAAKADIFVVGMYFGTAILALRRRRLPGVFLPVGVGAALAAYWVVRVPPTADHNLHHEVIRHTVAAASFGLVLFSLTTSRWQGPARLVDNRVLMPLSALAYSIYILHEAVLGWTEKHHWFAYTPTLSGYLFDLTLVLAMTVPIAWVAHRTIEMPWADTAWLIGRDGRPRELYPDLVGAAPDVPVRDVVAADTGTVTRLRPVDPGPSPAVALIRRLTSSGSARLLDPHHGRIHR